MNIGIFTDTFPPEINGVATSSYNLANALNSQCFCYLHKSLF